MVFYSVPCAELAQRLLDELHGRGLQVRRTFDLQSARTGLADPGAGVCPRHGTQSCSCQYMVIQASRGGAPLTVLLHGRDGFTEATLPVSPGNAALEVEVLTVLDGIHRARRRDGRTRRPVRLATAEALKR
jgi:hypothetical protein